MKTPLNGVLNFRKCSMIMAILSGFDVVIGNPPYIRQEEFSGIKNYLQTNFKTFAGNC